MQRTGLEWLHRLIQEPRRLWKRYAVDLWKFSYFFLWQWWVMRDKEVKPIASVPCAGSQVGDLQSVRYRLHQSHTFPCSTYKLSTTSLLSRYVVGWNLAIGATLWSKPARPSGRRHAWWWIWVQRSFLDSAAIGTLVALTKQARDAGGELWLINVPPALARVLCALAARTIFCLSRQRRERADRARQRRGGRGGCCHRVG